MSAAAALKAIDEIIRKRDASRTCANCKYWEPSPSAPVWGHCVVLCEALNCWPAVDRIDSQEDFGCVRFKAEEE